MRLFTAPRCHFHLSLSSLKTNDLILSFYPIKQLCFIRRNSMITTNKSHSFQTASPISANGYLTYRRSPFNLILLLERKNLDVKGVVEKRKKPFLKRKLLCKRRMKKLNKDWVKLKLPKHTFIK